MIIFAQLGGVGKSIWTSLIEVTATGVDPG